MKLKTLILCLTVFFIQNLTAQESATTVLEKAYEQAKIENKNVFVIFGASWCGWCRKMETNLSDESCKDLFEKNYVLTHLVVWESDKNKHLENPGALEILNEYKGENSGIPFWLIFTKNGKFLASSLDSKGKNIGCPANEHEVNVFEKILKETSKLTTEELKIIEDQFLVKK